MPDNSKKEIFLPGSIYQFSAFADKFEIKDKSVLIIGAGSEEISKLFLENEAASVIQIVEDDETLLSSRLYLKDEKNISVRLMIFENTDFRNERFDIIYAQASISNSRRNKILKEIKRILNPEGIFCVGENVQLEENAPAFVNELWQSSKIFPLLNNEVNKYYLERDFEVLYEEDFSSTLKDFYQTSLQLLDKNIDTLSDREKAYHKKFLNKVSHESNSYLNLGADRYMGFKVLILKKVLV
ncbi:MAG TPA: methyltransferase domain-containing protein [Ignavibacteriaceae bacterium]|nr:methyltransferase domain-containing protein [Ignavibacteriaceae bacterium]